jgi:predicted cupin superfamily sugar epimerase
MDPRASYLIDILGLVPHPEGGYFREFFRSPSIVTARESGTRRKAISSIYYLVLAGQVSKFHRVASDEVWHFLEGDTLQLHTLDPDITTVQTHVLGPVSGIVQPICIVPAAHWQAAEPAGAFTLAGCTVGPGFEYEDVSFLAEDATLRQAVTERFPVLARLL